MGKCKVDNEYEDLNKQEVELSPEEETVVSHLADAWNAYVKLEKLHDSHDEEMCKAIHQAQYLVMIRPVARRYLRLYPEKVTKKTGKE